jgi:hypothetical protein
LYYVANKSEEHIYIKTDGSLEKGLEIVTHPMTLSYHKDKMPWDMIMQESLKMQYLSHKTSSCGLHIHINRSGLAATIEEQEECISRILYFVEHHWTEMLLFSRRTEAQIKQWANRYGINSEDKPTDVLKNAKTAYNARYSAVNITNYDTIEFRLFRGTLNLNSLIAALQLVNAICEAAVLMSDDEVAELSWTDFTTALPEAEYPELIIYLKERGIYKTTKEGL